MQAFPDSARAEFPGLIGQSAGVNSLEDIEFHFRRRVLLDQKDGDLGFHNSSLQIARQLVELLAVALFAQEF